ncbi:TPA: winged helix family transcriptional regulator, partial [Candidatus Bipolaricaulota bacterium]|nr:winged helix family transcriptional regulator [Candidatus Bipolaricaulota bacterium]
ERGDLVIDLEARRVSLPGREVELTPTEFDLLVALARHPGRVFDRLQLLEAIDRYPGEGLARTIDTHIKNLRKKLEPDPANPRYIETVHGVGYRFRKEE